MTPLTNATTMLAPGVERTPDATSASTKGRAKRSSSIGLLVEAGRPVGRRVGVRNAATYGAAVTHGTVSNTAGHFLQHMATQLGEHTVFDIGMCDSRPDTNLETLGRDLSPLIDARNVNDLGRTRQTQIQHGAQRLAPAHGFDRPIGVF